MIVKRNHLMKGLIAVTVFSVAIYVVPWLTLFFLGNGVFGWLLSPLNLVADLLSFRNHGVYRLEDLPADYRAEVDTVLDIFRSGKSEITGRTNI